MAPSTQPLQLSNSSNATNSSGNSSRPRPSLPTAPKSFSSSISSTAPTSSTADLSRKSSTHRLSLNSGAQLPSQRRMNQSEQSGPHGTNDNTIVPVNKRLSASNSNASLRSDFSNQSLEDTSYEVRMNAMERRLKNFKADTVGLAKDILGLCEENRRSINRTDTIGSKVHAVEGRLEDEVIESRAVKVLVEDHESQLRHLHGSVNRLSDDVSVARDEINSLRNAFDAEKHRALHILPTSSPKVSARPVVDLAPLLARLDALERENAAKKTIEHPVDSAQEIRKQEQERRKARDTKEREYRVQALLGEALQRNLVLAARIRELEASSSSELSWSTSSNDMNRLPNPQPDSQSVSSVGLIRLASSVTSDKPPQLTLSNLQTPKTDSENNIDHNNNNNTTSVSTYPHRPRKSILDIVAPSLPALDPLSPFVLDRTVKRAGKARPKSNLRE